MSVHVTYVDQLNCSPKREAVELYTEANIVKLSYFELFSGLNDRFVLFEFA